MYKAGRWLCTPSDSEFLSVVRSTVDGLREACGALWMSIPTQTGLSRYTATTVVIVIITITTTATTTTVIVIRLVALFVVGGRIVRGVQRVCCRFL